MIDTIIEESYRKKPIQKTNLVIDETEKSEIFHHINNTKNFNSSSTISTKVKSANKNINSNIDTLLSFSVVDSNYNYLPKYQILKLRKNIVSSEPIQKSYRKKNKYLFKSDLSLSEKINKTKVKEFIFKTKRIVSNESLVKSLGLNSLKNIKSKLEKNIANNKNKKNLYNLRRSESVRINSQKNRRRHLSLYNDNFFITKIPNLYQDKTNIILDNLNLNSKFSTKEQKLKKMKKIVKESNSHMLDIYNGLKNLQQNKLDNFNNNFSEKEKVKSSRALRNIDKFMNLDLSKSTSVFNINRRFKSLFHKIFQNKKYSSQKLDARTIMDPLDKIVQGDYKEVKLDNSAIQKLGQRIYIKKTTANIVSFGNSFQKLSDDVFYKERKRIMAIYPKICEAAKIGFKRKQIKKQNPLIKKLEENVSKINDVFLDEYNLLQRIRRRMNKKK